MPKPTRAADVVVVGAGLAGHTAALAAAQGGAEVLLLEKGDQYGGSSAMSGGGLAFAGTSLQRREGVEDSPEMLRDDLCRAARGHGDRTLIDLYVSAQAGVFDWLCALGADFTLTGSPIRRLHTMPSHALISLLHQRVIDSDRIEHHSASRVVALLTSNGHVDGVTVEQSGHRRDIAATRGVVLATGGFSRNQALVADYAPRCVGTLPMGGVGSEGDGLVLARGLGAAVSGMEHVEPTFGASAVSGISPRLIYAHLDGAVIVNTDGQRFTDEANDIKTLGRAVFELPGQTAYQIFDQSVMNRSQETPSPRNYRAASRDGLLVEAGSINELAATTGIPEDALAVAATDLTTPLFYAYPCRAGLTATYGGLRVDGQLCVVDEANRPLPGLLAAGELVGGFHGAGYIIGSALGKAAVFGAVAGHNAAALLDQIRSRSPFSAAQSAQRESEE